MFKFKMVIVFLFASFFSSCIVPVQLTRVVLVESFTQDFKFGNDSTDSIKERLKLLLGKKCDYVTEIPEVVNAFRSGEFLSKGIATFTLSIVPRNKPRQFFISGNGAYDIYDERDDELNLHFSARFKILEQYYNIADLKDGKTIPVYFTQVGVAHFYKERCIAKPSESIKVDVKMKKIGRKIFSVDYSANHKVSIGGYPIGVMTFDEPKYFPDKLIDMRGLKRFLRKYRF